MYSSIQQGFTPLVSGHFFLPLDDLFLDRSNYIWLRCISLTWNHYQQLAFCQGVRSNCLLQQTKPCFQFSSYGNLPLRSLPVCGKFLIVWTLCMGLSPTLGKYHQKLGFWLEFWSKLWWCYRRKTPSLPWLVFYFWLIGYSCMILPAWKMAFAGLGHIIGALWHVDMVGLPCCLIYCNIGKSL